MRRAAVPAALGAEILTTGFLGTDAAALGRTQTAEAVGLGRSWTDSVPPEASRHLRA